MSLPLSAFFFSLCFFAFLPCCFHPSAFPFPLSAFSFPPSAFLPFPSLALSPFLPRPQHRLAITHHRPKTHAHSGRERTLILDDKRPKSFSCMPLPGRPGWKKQPETTLFPVLPPGPVWFRCCAADGQPYHHCHENRRPSVEVAGLEIERNILFFSFRRRQRRRRPFGRLLTGCTGCFQLDGRSIGCQRSGPAGLVWST